tara:strand:+ start:405 stop:551 length:147 start_codon:yes stop_codon:yes gene_type:complete
MCINLDEFGLMIDALITSDDETKKTIATYLGTHKLKELLKLTQITIDS